MRILCFHCSRGSDLVENVIMVCNLLVFYVAGVLQEAGDSDSRARTRYQV